MTNQPRQTNGTVEKHIQTIMLGVITTTILGLFGFVWKTNTQIIEMKTEATFRYRHIEEAADILRSIQSEIQNLQQRVDRLEQNKNNVK